MIQWNPSKPDTIGEWNFILYREVSLTQGLFCMCVYVNGTTDSVLYREVSLTQGVSFKSGSTVYNIPKPCPLINGTYSVTVFNLVYRLFNIVACLQGTWNSSVKPFRINSNVFWCIYSQGKSINSCMFIVIMARAFSYASQYPIYKYTSSSLYMHSLLRGQESIQAYRLYT